MTTTTPGVVKGAETQSTFRGTWQPILYKPAFNAFQFLPTPPPQQPRRRQETEQATEAPPPPVVVAVVTEQENEKEEEDHKEAEPLELLTGPPIPLEDVMFQVIDREKQYRACVSKDGTCTNNLGQVIGFVDAQSIEAGSVNEEYLGKILDHPYDNVYQIRDAVDDICGWVDMGTGTIRDSQNATVADFLPDGVLKHANGTYLGQFMGREVRGFHQLRLCALYLALIDPGMLSDVSG